MPHDCYLDPRVSKAAINKLFAQYPAGKCEIHAIEIFYRDALVARIAPAPYHADDRREIYSLSKSFCSTAIGFLVTDGKLSLNDRIVDLFPDKLPEVVSENLAKMRLIDVLSMTTGHERCVMPHMSWAKDAARAFLSLDVPYKPGTHNAYNTGATALLSCLVHRVTGMNLLDFLTARLFLPLGISAPRWNCMEDGNNEGGCGLYVSCDDIVKLGLLYLHDGVWNGKRLLSHEWVSTATSHISDNTENGSVDWCAGYGCQFWINAREGFRGDGAFGQLCFVLPQHEMVFAVQTELGDMQREVNCLYDLADHLFDEDDSPAPELPDYAPFHSDIRTAGFEDTFYRLDENPMGWTGMYLRYNAADDSMSAVFSDGVQEQEIRAGRGRHIDSTIFAKGFKPKLLDIMHTMHVEACRMAASYKVEDGNVVFLLRYLNSPHVIVMTFSAENNRIGIETKSLYGFGIIGPGSANMRGVRV